MLKVDIKMAKYLFVSFLFYTVAFNVVSQDKSELDQLKKAYLDIQNEHYEEAYPYFINMLKRYPKEPIYNYYVGRCLLFLEKDPGKSLNYLRLASVKEVPVDVYFYLGLAYLKKYRFKEALESFQWFEKSAGRKQIKDFNLSLYLSMAQNGIYLTKYIREPVVYQKKLWNLNEFYQSYFFENLEGNFKTKNEFFDEPNDSLNFISVLFVPQKLDNGDNIYFSAINEKRGDYDIYSITRLTDTTWSKPENLGDVINTPFDDNFPFMHSDGSTLYFASKGHYSMGGYDLYKSIRNWNTLQWSEPENLDFPVNSPYDDILFVSSPNKKTAYFASNRAVDSGNVMVYKIKLTNSEPYIATTNYQDVSKYARLDVNAVEDKKKDYKEVAKNHREGDDIVKIKKGESFLYRAKYDSLLNLAIKYQLKADSLKWIIDEKRLSFDDTESGQDRAQLSNSIIEQEREIYALQKKADQCYAGVREIEQANLASQKIIYDYESKKPDEFEGEKVQKIYVEPTSDSLSKSTLTVADEDQEEEEYKEDDFGLQVKVPSIYDSSYPIPINETLPEGLLYMIQLGAFSSEKMPSVFKGLTPLSSIKANDSNIRKYYAGKFRSLTSAEEKLQLVKSKGFQDAYIVAFYNGQLIPISKSIGLEKEQSVQKSIVDKKVEKEVAGENLEIVFVLKGDIVTKDSIIVKKIEENLKEGYDLFLEEKEEQLNFTIKSFKSYDSLLPVKNNLEAILKKEIEVHAYFAENQIPLEQARKITK